MLLQTSNSGLGLADDDKKSSRKSSRGKLGSRAAPLSSQHSKTILKAAKECDEEEEDYAEDGFENESITGAPGAGKTGNSELVQQLNEGAAVAAVDSDQDLDYE